MKKRPQYEYPVMATLTFLLCMIEPKNGKSNSAVGMEIMKYRERLSLFHSPWDEVMNTLEKKRPGLYVRVVLVIQHLSSKKFVDGPIGVTVT